MNLEALRTYCLSKKGTTEELPFDDVTLVFKVCNKMFCLTRLSGWEEDIPTINIKCDPEEAIRLRERYESIKPGYHMSKKHWNTINVNGDVDDKLILEMIEKSYILVVEKLSKKEKALLR